MRVCGSGDVRRRRLPCRSGKAVYWRAALALGHATTFAAARWRRAHRGPRRGTSSCRYRCRSRRSRYWVSETWRAPCLWCPSPASLAGGAGARPDHPIRRRLTASRELSPTRLQGKELLLQVQSPALVVGHPSCPNCLAFCRSQLLREVLAFDLETLEPTGRMQRRDFIAVLGSMGRGRQSAVHSPRPFLGNTRIKEQSMKSALRLLVFTMTLILVGEGFAQVPAAKPETVYISPERLSRIRTVLQKEVDADRMPGAVVMIARRGQLIYSEAIGFQDNAARKPMTKDAIFRIYSMTKPLASVAAMLLVEEARMELTDPVPKFLPQ